MGNNYYWGKLAASRNENIAKILLCAGLILMFIFMIPLVMIGAYTGAAVPEVFTLAGGSIMPTAAYGVAAKMFLPLVSALL